MESLYSIESKLLELFNKIEDNDGEITDEEYDILTITKENLKEKLDSYRKAISIWNGDIEHCKIEEKRIAAFRRVRENRVERLKKSMLDAVLRFGDDGKSGNKVLDLPTAKLYTRATPSVDLNIIRLNILVESIRDTIIDLKIREIDISDENFTLIDLVDYINETVANNYDDIEPFTIDDISDLKINISSNMAIKDFLSINKEAFEYYMNNYPNSSFAENTSKTEWKSNINNSLLGISVGEIVYNNSLIIK